jgi:hypothetical protein
LSKSLEILNPSLKLFLSVDVIGSTEYKSKLLISELSEENSAYNWRDFFVEFYDTFQESIKEWYTHFDEHDTLYKDFYLWKNLGDELVFIVEIKEEINIHKHLSVFKKSVKDFNKLDKELKVKGSAWIVEIPVTNAVIFTSDYKLSNNSENLDFIGPSIDIGFRISKFSSERAFVISVELAEILSRKNICHRFIIFFDGEQVVKGVLKQNKYPIIWIFMFNLNTPIEEKLYGVIRNPVNLLGLNKYCKEYIKKHKHILTANTIPSLENQEYKNKYNSVMETFYRQKYEDLFFDDTNLNNDGLLDIETTFKEKIVQKNSSS